MVFSEDNVEARLIFTPPDEIRLGIVGSINVVLTGVGDDSSFQVPRDKIREATGTDSLGSEMMVVGFSYGEEALTDWIAYLWMHQGRVKVVSQKGELAAEYIEPRREKDEDNMYSWDEYPWSI